MRVSAQWLRASIVAATIIAVALGGAAVHAALFHATCRRLFHGSSRWRRWRCAPALLAWWWARTRTPAARTAARGLDLTARPVFSTDERRVYRQLREALPHHIVLSKLPLVRFSQPTDPQQVRYWYELLGAIHVTFAICSANGRVLAAIDLDTDRGNSRRVLQIKQSVLAACRVRYLRCPLDHLPSIPELQLLVPQSTARSPRPQAAPRVDTARDAASTTVACAASRALARCGRTPASFRIPSSAPKVAPIRAGQRVRRISGILRGGVTVREVHAAQATTHPTAAVRAAPLTGRTPRRARSMRACQSPHRSGAQLRRPDAL